MTLQEIGLKYGTDKAVTHFYMDNYEKYFASWVDREFTLLEIGVAGGASIRAWREYFPKAKIFGIDNNPDCAGEGIFIGNATDEKFVNDVLAEIGEVDIVIEDSGHVGHETIKIFELFFPKIKSGGMIFIEDTAVFYNVHYSGQFESNGRSKVYNFFTDLAYHVDIAGRGCTGNVEYAINLSITEPLIPKYSRDLKAIHIYPSLWIFEKR